ncbi:MAG: sugar transferase [Burkholderiales bacterium]|nr:sugar transferase [Anaerolineae bacterium]
MGSVPTQPQDWRNQLSTQQLDPVGGRLKRAFDFAGASIALVLTAPIMLIAAALIRMFLGGPVIVAQKRIGFNGKVFVCYKFRTMVIGGDEICLGNVLRKSSIDELPQLFNVLFGDMSLVGPRAVVPEEIARYGHHARTCLRARPGLTGMWQTTGRNRISYRARVARDLYYARNWSLWLDLVVLIKAIATKCDETA